MAIRIYYLVGLLALAVIIFLLISRPPMDGRTFFWAITLIYAGVVACLHGIVGHSLNARQKGNLIFYPIAMGILFAVLAFIYFYLVMPFITP